MFERDWEQFFTEDEIEAIIRSAQLVAYMSSNVPNLITRRINEEIASAVKKTPPIACDCKNKKEQTCSKS